MTMMQFDRIWLGRQALVLKDGTAINLAIFDISRLSLDIDLDFAKNMPRANMLKERELLCA